MEVNNNSLLTNRIEVCLSDKDVKYLEALALIKRRKGMSDTIRMIVEEYRKNHRI